MELASSSSRDSSREDDSESSLASLAESPDHHNFLDIEAEDDEFKSDSSNDSDTDTRDGFDTQSSFRFFPQLPPELRLRIWEIFCPDLTVKARCLEFSVRLSKAPDRDVIYFIEDGRTLADSTVRLRRLMAVNQESRYLGSNRYPNTLHIANGYYDRATIRFNCSSDVIFLENTMRYIPGDDDYSWHPADFCEAVVNLAVPLDSYAPGLYETNPELCFSSYPNLKRLYFRYADDDFRNKYNRWAVSEFAYHYRIETFESEVGLGENTESLVCWPDLDYWTEDMELDLMDFQFHPHVMDRIDGHSENIPLRGLEIWPMVSFMDGLSSSRYRRLLRSNNAACSDESFSESDDYGPFGSGESLNEYESEGLDDASIDSESVSSASDVSNELSEVVDEPLGAMFSSPEPSADGGEDVDEGTVWEKSLRRPSKRRIVADSDSDYLTPDELRAKRARVARPIVKDSEDEAEEMIADRQRRPLSLRRRTAGNSSSGSGDVGCGTEIDAEKAPQDGKSESGPTSDDDESIWPLQHTGLAGRMQIHHKARST